MFGITKRTINSLGFIENVFPCGQKEGIMLLVQSKLRTFEIVCFCPFSATLGFFFVDLCSKPPHGQTTMLAPLYIPLYIYRIIASSWLLPINYVPMRVRQRQVPTQKISSWDPVVSVNSTELLWTPLPIQNIATHQCISLQSIVFIILQNTAQYLLSKLIAL